MPGGLRMCKPPQERLLCSLLQFTGMRYLPLNLLQVKPAL